MRADAKFTEKNITIATYVCDALYCYALKAHKGQLCRLCKSIAKSWAQKKLNFSCPCYSFKSQLKIVRLHCTDVQGDTLPGKNGSTGS